jgi:hypothetical protein
MPPRKRALDMADPDASVPATKRNGTGKAKASDHPETERPKTNRKAPKSGRDVENASAQGGKV